MRSGRVPGLRRTCNGQLRPLSYSEGPSAPNGVWLDSRLSSLLVTSLEWESVKISFDVEYFHRAWIVQELRLAREAILYTALKPADGYGDAAEAYEDVGNGRRETAECVEKYR